VRIDPRDLRAELEAKADADAARFRVLSPEGQLAALFGEPYEELTPMQRDSGRARLDLSDDDIPF